MGRAERRLQQQQFRPDHDDREFAAADAARAKALLVGHQVWGTPFQGVPEVRAMRTSNFSRRQFLSSLGAAPFVPVFLSSFHELAAAERKRVKIRDVQVMVMQGASRNYVLIKITSDAGLDGIVEAYGTAEVGVKEQVLAVKPVRVGKDPLERDRRF